MAISMTLATAIKLLVVAVSALVVILSVLAIIALMEWIKYLRRQQPKQ